MDKGKGTLPKWVDCDRSNTGDYQNNIHGIHHRTKMGQGAFWLGMQLLTCCLTKSLGKDTIIKSDNYTMQWSIIENNGVLMLN